MAHTGKKYTHGGKGSYAPAKKSGSKTKPKKKKY